MGEAEINKDNHQIIIRSDIFFYGDAATEALSVQVAKDITDHWNEPVGKVMRRNRLYTVVFDIKGYWVPDLEPEMIFENDNTRNNYFRIETFAQTDVSFGAPGMY